MHNGLPRCKALLFPLFRERLEFKKKTTAKANVRSVSASTPFVLKSEKEEVIIPPQQLAPLAFASRLRGSFCPWLTSGLVALTLSVTVVVLPWQRLSLVLKHLCTAGV